MDRSVKLSYLHIGVLKKSFSNCILLIGAYATAATIINGIGLDNFYKTSFINECFWRLFLLVLAVLVLVHTFTWISINKKKSASFSINGTEIHIMTGDLFAQKNGLKVIPMNEYFDTTVDDVIIKTNTIHGQFILKEFPESNRQILDNLISSNIHLNMDSKSKVNLQRAPEKTQKYRLGSVFRYKDFLLTAFSRFDKENCAFLYKRDYINFLTRFWEQVEIVYNGESLNVPLMGAHITRFRDASAQLTKQGKLEMLLASFKLSGFRINKPKRLNFIISEYDAIEIDFYSIEQMFRSAK